MVNGNIKDKFVSKPLWFHLLNKINSTNIPCQLSLPPLLKKGNYLLRFTGLNTKSNNKNYHLLFIHYYLP